MSQYSIHSPYEIDLDKIINNDEQWSIFAKKIAALPDPIKDLLFSTTTVEQLVAIADDYNFSESQSAELSRIIRDILLANTFAAVIVETMESKLNLNNDTARRISHRILTNLFKNAWNDIKALHRDKFSQKTSQSPPSKPETPINKNNIVDLRNKP